MKVQTLRTDTSAVRLMECRKQAPKFHDATKLPDVSKLGRFWADCKSLRRCGRPPYDRLLTNPFLRADYRNIKTSRETTGWTRDQGADRTVSADRSDVDAGEGTGTEGARPNGAAQRRQARNILDALQEYEEVRDPTLQQAAGQPRAQGRLPQHQTAQMWEGYRQGQEECRSPTDSANRAENDERPGKHT